jgi:VanZ family protein
MIKWLEEHKKISLIITILIAAEIFFFSGISGTKGPSISTFDFSIIYHFMVFFLFSFFLFVTIKGKEEIKIKHILIVFFISVIYSVSDEIHQIFVPFRTPDIFDILTDNAGILTSTILYTCTNCKNKIMRKA